MRELNEQERRLLALERVWATMPDTDINGAAATPAYRKLVDELIEREPAKEYAPIVVQYLRRKRRHRVCRILRRWTDGAVAAAVVTGCSLVAQEHATYVITELTAVFGGLRVA